MTDDARENDLSHLYALVYGKDGLRFCGCGSPGAVYGLVRDILGLCPWTEDDGWAKAIAVAGNETALYFIVYQLDAARLIEHGSSAYASWLTPKGKHYLALMREYAEGDLDEVGFPHFYPGDGECPEGCPHRFGEDGYPA